MIVWIVRRIWPYDGSQIEKVFLNKDDAKQYCKGQEGDPDDVLKSYLKYDSYDVVM